MSHSAGQSTDAANSAAMITSKNAGDDLKQLSSRSAQEIAKDDGATTGGDGGAAPVTAPFPGGDQ